MLGHPERVVFRNYATFLRCFARSFVAEGVDLVALGCHNVRFRALMLLRQLRALTVLAVLWGVPWAFLGAILGARFAVFDHAGFGIIPVLALVCAVYGMVIGLAFGLVIAAVARARTPHSLSVPGSALAIATVGFGLGARAEPGFGAAILFAIFGAVCAAISLRLARTDAPAT